MENFKGSVLKKTSSQRITKNMISACPDSREKIATRATQFTNPMSNHEIHDVRNSGWMTTVVKTSSEDPDY